MPTPVLRLLASRGEDMYQPLVAGTETAFKRT